MRDANLILFLAASMVVIVALGPDNILVLTRGVTLGRRAALVSAAGASVGLVTHSLFAAAGLSVLLARSAVAFSVVKYVGAAYLIYLGIRALLDRESFVLAEGTPRVGAAERLRSGRGLECSEPQDRRVLPGLLAAVRGRGRGGTALQLLALGLTFALLTWAIFSAIALFSGTLGAWLRTRPKLAGGMGWIPVACLSGWG